MSFNNANSSLACTYLISLKKVPSSALTSSRTSSIYFWIVTKSVLIPFFSKNLIWLYFYTNYGLGMTTSISTLNSVNKVYSISWDRASTYSSFWSTTFKSGLPCDWGDNTLGGESNYSGSPPSIFEPTSEPVDDKERAPVIILISCAWLSDNGEVVYVAPLGWDVSSCPEKVLISCSKSLSFLVSISKDGFSS
jgi:hypothetical protein